MLFKYLIEDFALIIIPTLPSICLYFAFVVHTIVVYNHIQEITELVIVRFDQD
jgi:hypothetical protein